MRIDPLRSKRPLSGMMAGDFEDALNKAQDEFIAQVKPIAEELRIRNGEHAMKLAERVQKILNFFGQ